LTIFVKQAIAAARTCNALMDAIKGYNRLSAIRL
jgi:hypothetical protein